MASDTLLGKMLIPVEQAIPLHSDSNVKFVDGSWFLKDRSGREEYEAGPRIRGAVYFDIDDVASKGPVENPRNIKHMMPPPALFAAAMDEMQISNDNHLIVYGTDGCVSSVADEWVKNHTTGRILLTQSLTHTRNVVYIDVHTTNLVSVTSHGTW